MEACRPGGAVQTYCYKSFVTHDSQVQIQASDRTSCRCFHVHSSLFFFLSVEWVKAVWKCKDIIDWHLEVKHHLPLFHQLHHLANDSRHECVCVYVCVCVCVCVLLLPCFTWFCIHWAANRDVLLQLFWTGTPLRVWLSACTWSYLCHMIFFLVISAHSRR